MSAANTADVRVTSRYPLYDTWIGMIR